MNLPSIVSRLAKTTYVVLFRTKPSPKHPSGQLTLLTEPGEGTVWSTHVLGIAKIHADLNKGMAATWGEAWSLLVKEYGTLSHLEDALVERIHAAQEESAKLQSRATDVKGVDAGGFDDNWNPNT